MSNYAIQIKIENPSALVHATLKAITPPFPHRQPTSVKGTKTKYTRQIKASEITPTSK